MSYIDHVRLRLIEDIQDTEEYIEHMMKWAGMERKKRLGIMTKTIDKLKGAIVLSTMPRQDAETVRRWQIMTEHRLEGVKRHILEIAVEITANHASVIAGIGFNSGYYPEVIKNPDYRPTCDDCGQVMEADDWTGTPCCQTEDCPNHILEGEDYE